MSDTHMADHETSHHPSTTTQLFGHESAQEAFLTALGTERLPHAWLISGPSGVGKATLAYAIARFMLSSPRGELASNARQAPPQQRQRRRQRDVWLAARHDSQRSDSD